MRYKKARDLKIQVAEDIKVLEASVTVIKASDNVAEIKAGESLDQKINTVMPLTPEALEELAKKVKDLLDRQALAVAASGDQQFESLLVRGTTSATISTATADTLIKENTGYLALGKGNPIIIKDFGNLNIMNYPEGEPSKIQSPITEDYLKKLTFGQLIRTLSIGAWLWIFSLLSIAIGVSYGIGYNKGSHQPVTISKQIPSLEQLSNYQISLLKEIYKYQKVTGLNKVIILRTGIIFDEATKKETSINIAVNVLGNRADQTRFEDLIISIPQYFLKSLPETKMGNLYVLTVTEEARKLLDKNL